MKNTTLENFNKENEETKNFYRNRIRNGISKLDWTPLPEEIELWAAKDWYKNRNVQLPHLS